MGTEARWVQLEGEQDGYQSLMEIHRRGTVMNVNTVETEDKLTVQCVVNIHETKVEKAFHLIFREGSYPYPSKVENSNTVLGTRP